MPASGPDLQIPAPTVRMHVVVTPFAVTTYVVHPSDPRREALVDGAAEPAELPELSAEQPAANPAVRHTPTSKKPTRRLTN